MTKLDDMEYCPTCGCELVDGRCFSFMCSINWDD